MAPLCSGCVLCTCAPVFYKVANVFKPQSHYSDKWKGNYGDK